MDEEQEAIWEHLHDALPPRWTIRQGFYDPCRRGWFISAVGPEPIRGRVPQRVTGFGEDEFAAVRDLDARLRGERTEDAHRYAILRTRLRLAYIEGAEDWAQLALGRSLKREELERVIRRCPRD
jgi:hypothetical protein